MTHPDEGGWIACATAMPPEDCDVLIYVGGRNICCASWAETDEHDSEGWWIAGRWTYQRSTVTHWRPLPPPPAAKTGEKK